ncbi:hypothetical protein NLI96_g11954 [Meripilus lineatus]|uniref:Uncharacterized protein n=1 Tax=Meripilus lineatus TaxID=2056292 RepID=A0AAD5UR06_9APHY|nr:hypothetical protein NLI96_g11954 [Physisporinus lineatus]
MPAVRTPPSTRISLAKYYHTQRNASTRARTSFAAQLAPRPRKKLTSAEKAVRRARRAKHSAELTEALSEVMKAIWGHAEDLSIKFPGHNPQYYFQKIMQQTHTPSSSRKVSPWNAFLSANSKKVSAASNPGANIGGLKGAPLISRELRETWNAMTHEEKMESTRDTREELEALRETKTLAPQNVAINCFHDCFLSVDLLGVNQISQVHARTGTEVLLVAVRANQDHFMSPRVFATSERVGNCFETVFKRSALDFSFKLEAFMLSGVQGVYENYRCEILTLKHKISDIILTQLQIIARPNKIWRMNYNNFATEITAKHAIVCEGWPLSTFQSPSSINSRTELDVLLNAWTTGVTSFRRLEPDEFKKWSDARFQAALQASQAQSHTQVPASRSVVAQIIRTEAAASSVTQNSIAPSSAPSAPSTSASCSASVDTSGISPVTAAQASPTPATSLSQPPSNGIMSVSGLIVAQKKPRKTRL